MTCRPKSSQPTRWFPQKPAARRLGLTAITLLAVTTSLSSQTHKTAPTERVTRAIGVYEWTGDLAKPTAARLVPVSLFLNQRTEDAGVYLARPVPFALGSGIVYSVEKAGEPIGTLTLDHATNVTTRHSANDDNPLTAWYGYGNFVPPAAERQTSQLKSSGPPAQIVTVGGNDTPTDEDSDRPSMTRRAETPIDETPAKSADSKPTPNPAPDNDPDRPTLKKRSEKAEDKADAKAAKKERESGAVIPLATSLNDDPNRPTMHRGKPLGSIVVAPLKGVPADLHQAAAVSDATYRDTHDFAREWESDNERLTTLVALQGIAQKRIAAYLTTNKLEAPQPAAPPADPGPPTMKRGPQNHHLPAKPAPMIAPPPTTLEDEQLKAYTLSYGGLPTFLYTAETPVQDGGPVYVTLVAQRLPSGEMQTSLASVTDAQHLDRTPWLRPIDAVDPDAGHRASLLFELRAQHGRQFALYRLTSAVAEQTFITGIIE